MTTKATAVQMKNIDQTPTTSYVQAHNPNEREEKPTHVYVKVQVIRICPVCERETPGRLCLQRMITPAQKYRLERRYIHQSECLACTSRSLLYNASLGGDITARDLHTDWVCRSFVRMPHLDCMGMESGRNS